MKPSHAVPIIETGDYAGESRPVIQKLAHSRELFDIYRLTYESYFGEKYRKQLDGLWIPHPEFDHIAETTIFVAKLDDEVVGTVSVTLDKGRGLPIEKRFRRACVLLRTQGRVLGQVWRCLVKESCALNQSISISLLTEASQHLISHGVQTGLFVVQEKSAVICEALFGAVTLIRLENAPGASDTCSLLMRGEMENLRVIEQNQKDVQHEQSAHFGSR